MITVAFGEDEIDAFGIPVIKDKVKLKAKKRLTNINQTFHKINA